MLQGRGDFNYGCGRLGNIASKCNFTNLHNSMQAQEILTKGQHTQTHVSNSNQQRDWKMISFAKKIKNTDQKGKTNDPAENTPLNTSIKSKMYDVSLGKFLETRNFMYSTLSTTLMGSCSGKGKRKESFNPLREVP